MRHDVEFSVEKAYELASIEKSQLGITSSYFFQIRNYTYNPFAHNNRQLIIRIHEMGHKIGLHVNTECLTSYNNLSYFVENELKMMQQGLDLPIDRYSFHRPSPQLLQANLTINGYINVYDHAFFHFYDNTPPKQLRINYFSDSEHRWKYGDPQTIVTSPINKLQLLIHPYSWSVQGLDNINNFKELLKLKYAWMIEAIQNECHHFPNELRSQ